MDLYIAADLVTDMDDAALSASMGVVINQRLTAVETAIANLATDADIDALFA